MSRHNLFALPIIAAVMAGPAAADEQPVVVELFTSQSCYSCPPAEAFLTELAQEDGVLALEFHVDYWNSLIYGLAGRWEDPFSSPAFTERQRDYKQTIPDGGVYTPQAVVDGIFQAVGSHRDEIQDLIAKARTESRPRVGITVSRPGESRLAVMLDGAGVPTGAAGTDVWYVRFLKERVTEVPSGENKGKTLTNAHVVTEMRRVGAWPGEPVTLTIDDAVIGTGEDCAILVQAAGTGPVLGAARCPAPQV